jgi:hypothetical protein
MALDNLPIRQLRIDPSDTRQNQNNSVEDEIALLSQAVDIAVIGYSNMIAVFITELGKLGTIGLVTLDNPVAPINSFVDGLGESSATSREMDPEEIELRGPEVSVKPMLGSYGPIDLQTVHLTAYGQALYSQILRQNPAERRPILLNCSLSTASRSLNKSGGRDELAFMRYIVGRISSECRVW